MNTSVVPITLKNDAVRAARLQRRVTNAEFLRSELTGLTKGRASFAVNPVIEYVREPSATELCSRLGTKLATARTLELAERLNGGFVFQISHARPINQGAYTSAGTMHKVELLPSQQTKAVIDEQVELTREALGFTSDSFYAGLVVTACASEAEARAVSDRLNSNPERLQAIGAVLGPLVSAV